MQLINDETESSERLYREQNIFFTTNFCGKEKKCSFNYTECVRNNLSKLVEGTKEQK